MDADLFPAIAAFARVAHHASFTRAAAELGVSPSALSQSMRALESRIGMRLLERTTRRVGLTEIGRRFLDETQPALAALAGAADRMNDLRDKPSGLLRLNLSRTAADIVVLPHLTDFLEACPDITVELHCDNALLDLVAGGFDAGIRVRDNLANDVVAVPLGGPHRVAAVASPRYLRGRGAPKTPADLAGHRCINVRLPGGLYRWEFAAEGRLTSVDVTGPIVTNDGDIVLAAARAGAGIALAFETLVADDIASGRLVALLEPWWPRYDGFCLYHPSRLHVPRKLRAFIDFLQARSAPVAATMA
jgi:DNA-binding transcriptional LysR family regulator